MAKRQKNEKKTGIENKHKAAPGARGEGNGSIPAEGNPTKKYRLLAKQVANRGGDRPQASCQLQRSGQKMS